MRKFFSLVLLFSIIQVTAQVSTGGLVAHYPLNNNVNDKSGNGNNGEIKGGVTTALDRHGNPCGALRFNGKDGYILIPNSQSLKSPVNAIAITAWVKPEKSGSTNHLYLPLLSKTGTGNAVEQAQYRFYLKRLFGDSYSDIHLSNNFSAQDKNYAAHPIEFNEWHFLAITFDEDNIQLFINGKLVWQTVHLKPFNANDFSLEIGRDMAADVKYFNGILDDIRIYKRGLSSLEITSLYNETASTTTTDAKNIQSKNIERNSDAGKCSATVTFPPPAIDLECGKVELNQVKGLPSGSAFDVGIHTIIYEGVTPAGSKITDSFQVIIKDIEPPVITCQKDTTVIAKAGSESAKVEFTRPTASDNCPNVTVEMLSQFPQGYDFPKGKTTVNYAATDASGNKNSCSFNVTVIEDVQPTMQCSKEITAFTSPTLPTARITYEEPFLELNGIKNTMKKLSGLTSGSEFPVGKHEIVFQEGNNRCSFTIWVRDTVRPSLVCPPDIRRTADYGTKSLAVNYTLPKASDGGKNIQAKLLKGLESGSDFPLGVTKIVYEAIDESGNRNECSFNVFISEDLTKPILSCTKDLIVFTPSNTKSAKVNYTEPFIDIKGNRQVMQRTTGLPSGSEFPLGVTSIVYETTLNGVAEVCRFTVTVKDTIAPTLSCPANLTKISPYGKKFIPVAYELPIASDGGIALSPKLIGGFGSGSDFPVGVTKVCYEVIDESGNKAQCDFSVIVNEASPPVEPPKPVTVTKEKTPTPNIPVVSEIKPAPTTKADEIPSEVTPSIPAKPTTTETKAATAIQEKLREAEKIFQPEPTETTQQNIPSTPVAAKPESKPAVTSKPMESKVEPIVAKPIKEEPRVTPEATKPVPKQPDIAKTPVKATKPLQLSCSNNIMKQNDPGKCGAIVTYPTPALSGGTEPKLFQTKGMGSERFFPLGTTINLFTAKDANGYLQECQFNVSVVDREAPVFSCPQDTIILLPTNRRGVIYYYDNPKVTDNCKIDSMYQSIGSKSGCFLQIGVHPFVFNATDASGNLQTCTFSVMVKEEDRIVSTAPPTELDASLELGNDSVRYEYKATVNSCLLTVVIYDDGEEDNDTVSVIFNGQVIVHRSMIRLRENGAILKHIVLDSGAENYLIAKAWNTGRYGLNTMKIEVYEGILADTLRELKTKKPSLVKVLHSKPGIAGGMLLKCSE